MPPYFSTPSGLRPTPRRPIPFTGLPGYASDEDEQDAIGAVPGLATDDAIDRGVAAALDAEGIGDDMVFGIDDPEVAAMDAPAAAASGRNLVGALASAFPSVSAAGSAAFRALPQAADALAYVRRAGQVASPADVFGSPSVPAPAAAAGQSASPTSPGSPSSPASSPLGAGATTQPYEPRQELAQMSEVFGGGAPSPVTPAPPSDKDTRRSDKMLASGSGFGMTADERAGLEDARRGDRRMRIAQGVTGGLGTLLGAIGMGTGNAPLAGLGIGIRGIGGTIPAGIREERALGDVERRQQALQAQQAADARQMQLATDADRVGVQRLGAEAGMVRAQGQAQLDLANAANAQFERLAAEGNAEGMREVIRSLITAMPDDARKAALVNRFMRGTPSGDAFDRVMDLPSLRAAMDEVANLNSPGMQIERARGRGIGPASGGMSIDPTTGQVIEQQARGGGGRAPAGPTFSDPFSAPTGGAPVVAPAPVAQPRRGARGRVASGAAAPVAATAADTPPPEQRAADDALANQVAAEANVTLNTDLRQRIQDMADTLRDEGIDPASDSGARELRTLLAGLTSSSSGVVTQTEAELRARQTAANEARAAGLEIGVPPGVYNRLDRRLTPLIRVHREIDGTLRRLRAYRSEHPLEFRAALAGRPVPGEGNAQIYGEILTYFGQRKHAITGAAASDAEARQIMDSIGLNLNAAISDPDAFLNLMAQARDAEAGEIMSRARTIDRRGARRFLEREYPQYARAFAAALGGD